MLLKVELNTVPITTKLCTAIKTTTLAYVDDSNTHGRHLEKCNSSKL